MAAAPPSTPDLADQHPDTAQALRAGFVSFGGREAFSGPAQTVKCFEDNSKVKELAATPGEGRVLVVDGGGSLRRALLGDLIAAAAAANGWAGFVIGGAVRDVEVLRDLNLGIKALGAIPLKTDKRGIGDVGVPVEVGGVVIRPGDQVFADATGIVVLPAPPARQP
ncbi:MAG: ribonuclease E activity regulator RraA [Bifidobacteriaceae bacterium]|jgi:regulator of ribonuclease activity A|nr:ribonuclease E activity regulator RraA [Bifidobacteriaceae bacterium]